jgi:RNA polymerase sigma-70 factor (ECF subfamily)
VHQTFYENSVENDINIIENKELVEKILQRMSEKYKEVLILKFLEEKDYKEISDILQKPMGSIATLINRAKKQFKKEVEELEENVKKKKK